MRAPHVLVEDLRLDPTAFVAPGATVVGRVTLGARASVWFSAVIRGDMDAVTLGEESNLQDGAVIHVDEGFPTRVGRRVTIGHRAGNRRRPYRLTFQRNVAEQGPGTFRLKIH